MTRSPAGYLSFLDLMSCGLGGTLLLLLIMAAARSTVEKLHPLNTLMMVRCAHKDGPRPEVRLECRPPGEAEWVRLDRLRVEESRIVSRRAAAREVFVYTAPAEQDRGGDSFALIYDPRPGEWEFRAYLVGFPRDRPPGPVQLRLEADGEGVEVREATGRSAEPVWPGAYTSIFRVTVLDPISR